MAFPDPRVPDVEITTMSVCFFSVHDVGVCCVDGQPSEWICSIPISSLTKCHLERSPNNQKEGKKKTKSHSQSQQYLQSIL